MTENFFMSNINNPPLNYEERKETKKDSPEKELIEELKQVGQITSTHGIARLISRPLSLKIIWAIFFLISIGACLFILVGNFRDYFKFDVNTLVKVVPQDTIPLPSITVCNLNPLITQTAQQYIANYYKDVYNITISSYKQFQNLTRSGIIPNDITWLFYQSQTPGFNATLRDSFGFSLDEQALWCKLLFGTCYREAFRRIYHSNYGNCFVFNSGLQSNGSEIDLVQVSAEEFGLDMAIFTGLADLKEPYFVERLRGIVLIIEQQNFLSLGQGQILLKPGSYANIALTIKNSTNLPLPYNSCYDRSSMKSTVLTDGMRRLNMTYDRSNCFSMCLQKGIIEAFGCYDVRYPALFDNVPPCITRDLYLKVNAFSMSTDDCELECPFDCNQVIYDMSISYASFPNYNSFKIINRTNYEFLSGYFPNGSFDYFDLQNTSVGFFIYFDPLTTLMISQTPMYSFPDLVSNAGGTLGVFLGLSLLSFVELIEVAILVCIFIQKKYTKGPKINLKSKLEKFGNRDVKEIWIRLKDEFKRSGEMTTLHAIPNVVVTKYMFIKIMWILFFLVSVAFCIYMVVRVITIYQQFNLSSSIRDMPQEKMNFPSIWFCNPNFMTTAEATQYLTEYYLKNDNVTLTDFDSYFDFANVTDFYSFYWPFYQTFDPKFNETLMSSFSYSLEDMVINCELGSKPCNLSWFDTYRHPIFGDCFQFNTGNLNGTPNSVDIIQIDTATTGLYLELFTGLPDEYYQNFLHEWKYNSINMFISDQGHLPIDKYGRPIKPGVSASISLTLTHYINLPPPYTECQYVETIDTDIVRNMQNANLTYDRFNCITLCQQFLAANGSGCYNMAYPNVFGIRPCENYTEFLRNRAVKADFSLCPKWCPPECEQLDYREEISYSEFPTRNYAYKMMQNRNEFYTRLYETENITYDMFKKSVTSMYIYFEDLIVTEIVESPSVLFVDLISNIGGLVGLFIGSSVLTIVEFFELAVNSVSIWIRYSRKKRNT